MSFLSTESDVMKGALSLCEAITNDGEFKSMHANVEAFLSDDQARQSYQAVHEKGAELQDKQRAGIELTPQEMTDFELMREELLQNQKVMGFMEAQQGLQVLQKTINDYVGLTIELGRIPSEQELMEASSGGGCCGGGGGGGCGC